VLGVAGDTGDEQGSTEMFLKYLELFVLTIVMLRVMFMSSMLLAAAASTGGDDRTENESYFRSLPSPLSGMGPASVSSHSLWRNPIIYDKNQILSCVTTERGLKSKQFSSWLFRSVRPENVRLLLREGKGSETQREDKRKGFFFSFLGFFFL
jgi:hypothetical protein